jgi:hypothetical protein
MLDTKSEYQPTNHTGSIRKRSTFTQTSKGEDNTHRSNRAVVVGPLAVEDLDGVAYEHRLVALKGHVKVHGVGEDYKSLSFALGLGMLAGVENDDVEDDEALEEGHDVLEVDVVRDAPNADAGEGAKDVFEGVHGRADTDNADVGVAAFGIELLSVGGVRNDAASQQSLLVELLGLLRSQLLMSGRGRDKMVQMRRRGQGARNSLEALPWLLLLKMLLTTELRLRWRSSRLVSRRSTRR